MAFAEQHKARYPVAPGEIAMAIVPVAPVRFRIGPERHRYVYEEYHGITVGDRPVYRCAKGRDDDPKLLYLYWSQQRDAWQAVSVANPTPSAQDIQGGADAFRADPGVDVRQPGRHQWQCYDNAKDQRWPSSPFDTTEL